MAPRQKAAEKQAKAAVAERTISGAAARAVTASVATKPNVPAAIQQYWLEDDGDEIVYRPALVGAAEIVFSSSRYKVEEESDCVAFVMPEDGPVPIDWDEAQILDGDTDSLVSEGDEDASYAALPKLLSNARKYTSWERNFKRWIRKSQTITLFKSAAMKATSAASESEGEFRARLQNIASEKRDIEVGKLRKRFASKMNTLENRLLRAQQAIEREASQSKKKKLDTAISFGTAILGAVLGRKRISATSARGIGSAVKTMGGMGKEAGDVDRARETEARVKQELTVLQKEFEAQVTALDTAYNAQDEELDEIIIKPKSTDIQIHFVGLLWIPHERDSKGRLTALLP